MRYVPRRPGNPDYVRSPRLNSGLICPRINREAFLVIAPPMSHWPCSTAFNELQCARQSRKVQTCRGGNRIATRHGSPNRRVLGAMISVPDRLRMASPGLPGLPGSPFRLRRDRSRGGSIRLARPGHPSPPYVVLQPGKFKNRPYGLPPEKDRAQTGRHGAGLATAYRSRNP